MDLRWQIQHNEKNWNREKVELLDRLDRDRREWERQKKELLRRIEQVRSRPGVSCTLRRHCTAVTLRPRSGDCIKQQHRKRWGSLAASAFLMLQNNLYAQGSKRKVLLVPVKDHVGEIGPKVKAISCHVSLTPDRDRTVASIRSL